MVAYQPTHPMLKRAILPVLFFAFYFFSIPEKQDGCIDLILPGGELCRSIHATLFKFYHPIVYSAMLAMMILFAVTFWNKAPEHLPDQENRSGVPRFSDFMIGVNESCHHCLK